MPEQVRHEGWWLALLALFFAVLALPAAAQTFPKYTGLVVDAANVLPPAVEQDLTAKLEALQKDTKRQLVVVTVPDTQGEALEVYANKLARSWGVGLRDIDNGAVLLIAPGNPAGQRGPRIEVGYGLEPVLTDALSSVIIRQRMMPLIRQDVPGAVTAGADAIIQQLRATPEEAQARQDAAIKEFDRTHTRGRASGGGGAGAMVVGIMILGFVILAFSRRSYGRSGVRGGGRRYRGDNDSGLGSVILWSIANEVASSAFRNSGRGGWGGGGGGSGWGGGGGGSDGSWGGGGFTGGGGGDFGGGGASGDW
ncbi:TPM domain-containing protein [Sphingomonas sp.]|jgi:uncharacterized protein|uniref:TPM domain-containing protein n=1 Tax=Sphingomonas sp. TaxID=28214 RepID=UPI0035C84D47